MLGHTVGDGARVAVVGSGISGLAAALHLERAGYDVEVIEREATLGGRFGVGHLGERPVMLGATDVGRRHRAYRSLLATLGTYAFEPLGADIPVRDKGMEITRGDGPGRLRALARLRRAGSPRDLAALAVLAARVRADETNAFLGSPCFTRLARRHDHQPLSARFGPRLTTAVLRPLTVRASGAEPDEVHLGTFGTALALLVDGHDQLREGIQPALDAFARRVPVRTRTRAEGLVVRGGRVTGLRLAGRFGGVVEERAYAGVVLAVPAHAAAEIVRGEVPHLGKRLGDVRYFPASVALVEYDRPVFPPEVPGLALDDGGPCSRARAYGGQDRHIVRYTFSGRPCRTADGSPWQLENWVGETEQRLTRCLGASRAKRLEMATRHWGAAHCAHLPYHGDFLTEVRTAVAALPGLELAGDYLWGGSLEACCRSGGAAAARLTGHLDAFAGDAS